MRGKRVHRLRVEIAEAEPARDAVLRLAARAAQAGGAVTLSYSLWQRLIREAGSEPDAFSFLQGVASRIGFPVGANRPRAGGKSETVLLAPSGWDEARLEAFIRQRSAGYEGAFGPWEGFYLTRQAPGGAR